MSYLLHEHLVCEETEGRSRCRETFVKAARPFLIFAEIQIFESQRRRQKISNRLELRMPFKKTMKFKNELGLYQ